MSGSEFFKGIPLLEQPWKIYARIFLNAGVGGGVFILTSLFYKYSPGEYMKHLKAFFTCMHTPVDFEKEVGGAVDLSQLLIVGAFTTVTGAMICLLVFMPNSWGIDGRGGILFVGGMIASVGTLLYVAGWRSVKEMRRLKKQAAEQEVADENE